MGHAARGRRREDVLPKLRRVSPPGRGAHQPLPDVRRARADVDEARRPNRSRAAGRLRHRSHISAVAAHAAEPHEHRHHQRLRQSARHLSRFTEAFASSSARRPWERPTRHIACRFGIDDPAELETIPDGGDRPAPLASDSADALVHRRAQWTHVRHTRVAHRDRPAHPRARRAQHSAAGRRGRLERAVRPRAECDRRSPPFSQRSRLRPRLRRGRPRRTAGARRKAHRAVSRPCRSLDAANLRTQREPSARRRNHVLARPPGLSRCGQLDEPSLAHRRRASGRRGDDAFALLPENDAIERQRRHFCARCSTATWRTISCGR